MQYLIGGLLTLFLLGLIIAGVTGRVRLRSCCSTADPAHDLRMKAAFADDDNSPAGFHT